MKFKKKELDALRSQHMLGYSDLLSRPSIEMNAIWWPISKMLDKKNQKMSSGKKSYIVVVIGDVRALSL